MLHEDQNSLEICYVWKNIGKQNIRFRPPFLVFCSSSVSLGHDDGAKRMMGDL